jgi:hypothetical protein
MLPHPESPTANNAPIAKAPLILQSRRLEAGMADV